MPDRQLDPYLAEFLPMKEGREPKSHQHIGYEFLYMISGELDIRHGEVVHHVEQGDAIYFDASTTHTYLCGGEAPGIAVIVTLQQPIGVSANGGSPRMLASGNGQARLRKSIPGSFAPAPDLGNGARGGAARAS